MCMGHVQDMSRARARLKHDMGRTVIYEQDVNGM